MAKIFKEGYEIANSSPLSTNIQDDNENVATTASVAKKIYTGSIQTFDTRDDLIEARADLLLNMIVYCKETKQYYTIVRTISNPKPGDIMWLDSGGDSFFASLNEEHIDEMENDITDDSYILSGHEQIKTKDNTTTTIRRDLISKRKASNLWNYIANKIRETFGFEQSIDEDTETEVLPIENGGTGATDAATALTNLGAFSVLGGTVTGNVELKNQIIDRDGEIPLSDQQGQYLQFQDKDGEQIGVVRADRLTDGRTRLNVCAYAEDGNSNEVVHPISIYADPNGAHLLSAGPIESNGDITAQGFFGTGNLTLKDSEIDRDGDTSDSTQTGRGIYLQDKDGEQIGMIRADRLTDGRTCLNICAYGEDGNGNEVVHPVLIYTNPAASTAMGSIESSGSLELKDSVIDRDGDAPGSTQNGRGVVLRDKDGERIGLLRADRGTDGRTSLNVGAFGEKSDGTEVATWLILDSMGDGKTQICSTSTLQLTKTTNASGTEDNRPALIVGGTAAQAHLEFDRNEIMAKSDATHTAILWLNPDGGTVGFGGNAQVNGHPFIAKSENLTSNTTVSTATDGNSRLRFYDSASTAIGGVCPRFETDGRQKVRLYTNRDIGGTTVYNAVDLGIDGSGNRTVGVSDAAAWRQALNSEAPVNAIQLASASGGRQSVKCTMVTNGGMLVIRRADFVDAIVICDNWSASVGVFGYLPSEIAIVRDTTTTGNTRVFTIQNNLSSYAITLLGINFVFDTPQDQTSALKENVTRRNFAPSYSS